MPRTSKGSARFRRGRWTARVTLGPGHRVELALPTCGPDDAAKAQDRAELLTELADRLRAAGHQGLAPRLLERAAARDGQELEDVVGAVDRLCEGAAAPAPTTLLTFRDVGEAWTSGELADRWPDHVRRKRTAHRDRALLEQRVYPLVGDVLLVDFRLEHAERVMQSLPKGLAAASRRQYAQAISRVMRLAAYPVRAIERSPIPSGFVPPLRSRKALSYLYPDEDRALLAAAAVPLGRRVLWGFLAREGMREGEARAMVWSDLDLERGVVTLDRNKTDDPRAWMLDPGVVRGMARWRALLGAPDAAEPVFERVELDWGHAAKVLRADLAGGAGVRRAELFEKSAQRLPVRVHDLRGTFVTLALATGRTEAWVADRTGHRSSAMINRYRRLARTAHELELGALSPLDEAVPELRAVAADGDAPEDVAGAVAGARPSTTETGSRKSPGSQASRAGGIGIRRRLKRAPARSEGADTPDSPVIPGPVATPTEAAPGLPPLPEALPPLRQGGDRGPRTAMIAALSEAVSAAAAAGDLAAARVAHRALAELLGEPAGEGECAEVVDLRKGRGR